MFLFRCTKRLIMRLYAATKCLLTETYRHTTCPSCLPFRCFPHSPLFLHYLECKGNTNKHNFSTGGNKASHAFLRTHSTTCRQSGLLLNAGTWQKHIFIHNMRLCCSLKAFRGPWNDRKHPQETNRDSKIKKSHVNACKKWSEAHTREPPRPHMLHAQLLIRQDDG